MFIFTNIVAYGIMNEEYSSLGQLYAIRGKDT